MYGGLKSLEAGDPINYSRVAALIFPFAWELIGHSKCPSRQSRIDEGDLDGGALARKKTKSPSRPGRGLGKRAKTATPGCNSYRREYEKGREEGVLACGPHGWGAQSGRQTGQLELGGKCQAGLTNVRLGARTGEPRLGEKNKRRKGTAGILYIGRHEKKLGQGSQWATRPEGWGHQLVKSSPVGWLPCSRVTK